MMIRIAKLVVFISLFGCFYLPNSQVAALAQVQQNVTIASLAGRYRVEGRNPDGSAYSGSLKITDVDGVANFEWQVGSRAYKGQGVIIGNVLVVNWGSDAPVVYTIDLNGNLAGTWARGTAIERLLRQ